jgi:DNA-binding SARP family transcriptional activator/tetratricopeptide (TPR) repeat protein
MHRDAAGRGSPAPTTLAPARPGSGELPVGLDIRVLGPLEVDVDGTPLVVDTRKAIAILAILAVEGRPFAREELAALLWPDSDDEAARGALRRTLSVLRSALGDRWLVVDRTRVALDHDSVRLDVRALQALVAETGPRPARSGVHGGASAPPASSTAISQAAAVSAATAIVRGPFLAGFSLRDSPEFDDWRATRATFVEREVLGVFDRLAAVARDAGDVAAAVRAATKRVDLDPLDEGAHRRLMALLAEGGDRPAAIRQYRSCVGVLERELGVAPLGETTALYESIRDGGAEPRKGDLVPVGESGRPRTGTGPDPALPPPPAPPAASGAVEWTGRVTEVIDPRRLPMVGRDGELRALLDTWATAISSGRVAVLEGEAGIGKTRLGDALVQAAEASGARVLSARAWETEAAIPYGPIVDLVRAALALPDAAERLASVPAAALAELDRLTPLPARIVLAEGHRASRDPDVARARLLEAIVAVLAAAVSGDAAPGVLRIDDAQWVDEATRETLAYLLRRLDGRPVLVLLAWRREDLDARAEAFAGFVEGLPGTSVIRLPRLEPTAVTALLASAGSGEPDGRAASALVEESEGLPLYVVEALATGGSRAGSSGDGAGTAPRGVRTLMRERLSRVSETAGQVLAAAAVVGRSFDLAIVRGASGRSEEEAVDALDELARRGIIHEAGLVSGDPSYDFAHARLRDEAYEGISLARRRLLHRRVADLLRATPGGRDDHRRLATVARHERAAGRDREAAEAFREAGLQAGAVYANGDALEHLETALALGHPEVGAIELAIGDLATARGDYLRALTAYERAAALAAAADLPEVELRLGRLQARRGELAAAMSHLDAALDGTAADDSPLTHRRLLVERGIVALRAGDLDDAASAGGRALEVPVDRDASGEAAARRLLGLVARERGDVAHARAELGHSLRLALEGNEPVAAVAARNALALVEAGVGDRETAISLLEAALADCRRTGERHLEAAVENNLADQLQAAGRRNEAMEHLKRAVTLFADVGGQPDDLEPEIWKLVTW